MGQPLELQERLETILGSENVYFEPPTGTQMTYPCIVYERDSMKTKFANNLPYSRMNRYLIKVIDRRPQGPVSEKVEELPTCVYVRSYVSDGLHHTLYNLYN